jgi:hypothetical protein
VKPQPSCATALQAMATWAQCDEIAPTLLPVQVEPSEDAEGDAFLMQSGSGAVRLLLLAFSAIVLNAAQ